MDIPLYLAMTSAEWENCNPIPKNAAWMACHFSPYSSGLSNVPKNIENSKLLIINDRIPPFHHSPEQIVTQLKEHIHHQKPEGVLLDFQQPKNPDIQEIALAIIKNFEHITAVTPTYAKNSQCPVFLPPVPYLQTCENYLKPWAGRSVWLETSFAPQYIKITDTGYWDIPAREMHSGKIHYDKNLCVKYQIKTTDKEIYFCLWRDWEANKNLLNRASLCGVKKSVALYQEYILTKNCPVN